MTKLRIILGTVAIVAVCGCSTTIKGLSVNPTTGELRIDQYTSGKDIALTHTKSGSNQTWSVTGNASNPTRATYEGIVQVINASAAIAAKGAAVP